MYQLVRYVLCQISFSGDNKSCDQTLASYLLCNVSTSLTVCKVSCLTNCLTSDTELRKTCMYIELLSCDIFLQFTHSPWLHLPVRFLWSTSASFKRLDSGILWLQCLKCMTTWHLFYTCQSVYFFYYCLNCELDQWLCY